MMRCGLETFPELDAAARRAVLRSLLLLVWLDGALPLLLVVERLERDPS